MLIPSAFSLLILILSPNNLAHAATPKNAVLLSKIQSLTLRSGLKTSHRRVSAIPQLTCVGGNAKDLYDVDVMRCKNSGSDYDDDNIQWTCTASLPEEIKLGSTDVICEGYSSPADPYVLKGSCGVEYRLVLTEKGEKKYGRRGGSKDRPHGGESADSGFAVVFWILFIGVLGWMIYSFYTNRRNAQPRVHHPSYLGFGGGGGGDDNDDPPPPYTPGPGWNPKTAQGASSQRNQGWRPGFWSGALGGAAAGYAAGSRNNTGQSSSSPLFGGGRNGGSALGNGEGSPRRDSSSSSGHSSTRYQSTGFGSSSRR